MTQQDSPTTPGRQAEEHTPAWATRDYSQRYGQALWYAWGRQDGGETLVGDAFKFADFYIARVRAFDSGRSHGFLASVQECFAQWQNGAES